jgi:hypothetical protein
MQRKDACEDENCHTTGGVRRVKCRDCKEGQVNDRNNQANPEALLAEIVHIPCIVDGWPEETLQTAVGFPAFSRKIECLHGSDDSWVKRLQSREFAGEAL